MTETKVIDIGADFTRYPAGRTRADGSYSGERFRDEFLMPALQTSHEVALKLDGPLGYGSSFLEEAFGGLVREHHLDPSDLISRLKFVSEDSALIAEIRSYIETVH